MASKALGAILGIGEAVHAKLSAAMIMMPVIVNLQDGVINQAGETLFLILHQVIQTVIGVISL